MKRIPVGVSWGNHAGEELVEAGAAVVLQRFEELHEFLPPLDGQMRGYRHGRG